MCCSRSMLACPTCPPSSVGLFSAAGPSVVACAGAQARTSGRPWLLWEPPHEMLSLPAASALASRRPSAAEPWEDSGRRAAWRREPSGARRSLPRARAPVPHPAETPPPCHERASRKCPSVRARSGEHERGRTPSRTRLPMTPEVVYFITSAPLRDRCRAPYGIFWQRANHLDPHRYRSAHVHRHVTHRFVTALESAVT